MSKVEFAYFLKYVLISLWKVKPDKIQFARLE